MAQRWWLVSSGAWLPVPSGQGAFPSHRLPSSCRLERPVPIPVPAASPPAPQGPPSPSFLPAASWGTHCVSLMSLKHLRLRCPQGLAVPQFVARMRWLGGDRAGGGPMPIAATAPGSVPPCFPAAWCPSTKAPHGCAWQRWLRPCTKPLSAAWGKPLAPGPCLGRGPGPQSSPTVGQQGVKDPPNSVHM